MGPLQGERTLLEGPENEIMVFFANNGGLPYLLGIHKSVFWTS